jgi:hypothetical protein
MILSMNIHKQFHLSKLILSRSKRRLFLILIYVLFNGAASADEAEVKTALGRLEGQLAAVLQRLSPSQFQSFTIQNVATGCANCSSSAQAACVKLGFMRGESLPSADRKSLFFVCTRN